MLKKPIIFLNIDGVLISENYILKNSNDAKALYTKIDNNYYMNFEKSKIELIKQLIDNTNACIVIVSYWCENNDLTKIKKIFEKYQLSDKIIDIVPYTPKKSGYRVKSWINKKSDNFPYINNKNFVIIDNDETGILENKHIKCNSECGLTEDDISSSIKLLKKQR